MSVPPSSCFLTFGAEGRPIILLSRALSSCNVNLFGLGRDFVPWQQYEFKWHFPNLPDSSGLDTEWRTKMFLCCFYFPPVWALRPLIAMRTERRIRRHVTRSSYDSWHFGKKFEETYVVNQQGVKTRPCRNVRLCHSCFECVLTVTVFQSGRRHVYAANVLMCSEKIPT